ncbi:MAG: class I SAM-dependent methyltransferase [Ruminococcus sp.]|nr:class I SAM-dependent methyltransferase [Ruminococcus sp.]MCM1381853.1 class I SAM-dependent methyltransferase [Muribaculaceae bacterium]MCM1478595.1 class I SAM-dependent methyltransferase [Muribaculaceae bacterium]
MSGYRGFSYFYDALTGNISYKKRAEYFDMLVRKHGGKKNLLLDLACGTGSLSEEMSRLGYDVIGVDGSEDMLNAAIEKKIESGLNIQYLCQDMTKLDMFGTIDVTICALDSLNHLPGIAALEETVRRVSLFCEPSGLFLFDVNTPHKHRNILANNTFIYDLEEVYCVWQNAYSERDNRVEMQLDIFERQTDGSYKRYEDSFSEIAFEESVLDGVLAKCGFEIAAKYDYDTVLPPKPDSEKLVYAARKV